AVAAGDNATATGLSSVAVGGAFNTRIVDQDDNVLFELKTPTEALGDYGTALGSGAMANYDNATSVGANAISFTDGTAVGFNTTAGGAGSVAVGRSAKAIADYGVAVGANAQAGQAAAALGV